MTPFNFDEKSDHFEQIVLKFETLPNRLQNRFKEI